MKLDGVTSSAFPARDLRELFPSFSAPVSANFNGASKDGHAYKVHVNPADSVRLTHEKFKLFEKLSLEGLPVPKYDCPPELLLDGYFCIDKMEEAYGEDWGEFPLHLRNRDREYLMTDIDDAFQLIEQMRDPRAVIFQSAISSPKIAQVTGIPAMAGRPCRNGAKLTHNGVLAGDIFSTQKKAMEELALLVIETIGLDYGTVVFGYSEESFEIYDIECRLKLESIPALSHFIEIMCNAARTTGKRKN